MRIDGKTAGWKHTLGNLVLPVSVAAGLSAFLVTREAGGNLEWVVLTITVGTLLLAMAVERLLPYRQNWNRSHGDLATDLSSAFVLIAIVEPLLKYLGPVGVVALYGYFDLSGVYAMLLGQKPFLLQLIVVTLLIELGRYWSHRLHHRIPPLWWWHAMHHSSERLYTINNLRLHPLNHGLNFALSIFPLMLLGTPADVLLGYLALTQPILMLQHANIASRNGLLNYLFSTNELHRWHHSTQVPEANSNFGNALMLWDQLFGTFHYRPNRSSPAKVGLFHGSSRRYPSRATYLSQLLSMLSRQCCRV